MRSNKILLGIVILQGLLLIGQWTGQTSIAREARGELTLPDPGARQLAMVDELKALNAKMDQLQTLLQSGEMRVRVAKPDEK